jgi:tryptophan 2,3-dioxygenase
MKKENELHDKFAAMGLNPEIAMEGLIHLKPINYWEYVQLDTLLSLQNPRTHFADEYIFIVYHQITELVFNLMLHELKQICVADKITNALLEEKLPRLSNYTRMLINSFGIMTRGMDYDQYNIFRHSLAPASGFQSAQYRKIEIYSTRLHNLSAGSKASDSIKELFKKIYWQHAGLDHKTGKKTYTLKQFEEKYLTEFMKTAKILNGNTLEDKLNELLKAKKISEKAKSAAREFDNLYNIKWPLVHLETAEHYLNAKGENKAATGGSEWKKYLHPAHQKRIFFPEFWNKTEKENWGK